VLHALLKRLSSRYALPRAVFSFLRLCRFSPHYDLDHARPHKPGISRFDPIAITPHADIHNSNTIAMMDTIYQRRRSFDSAIWLCIRSVGRSLDAPRPGPIWQAWFSTCLSGSVFRTLSCSSLRRPILKTYDRSRRDGLRPFHTHGPMRDGLWLCSRYPFGFATIGGRRA